VGGLLGALAARRFAEWVGQGPAIWMSIAFTAPAAFVAPFVHRGWTLGLLAVSMLVIGVGVVVYNITQVSFRQGLCPERLLGRMNATVRFLVWGTMPLGGLLGGLLGSWIGLRPTLLLAAAVETLATLPVFLSPLRRMRELPQEYGETPAAAPAALAEPAAGLLTEPAAADEPAPPADASPADASTADAPTPGR
jgi:MFS family permease